MSGVEVDELFQALENRRKRQAIQSYVRVLPRHLANDYGRRRLYTPKQVQASVERANLSSVHQRYAMAIYCSQEKFERFYADEQESCGFEAARKEVADLCFDGEADFDTAALVLASTQVGVGNNASDVGGFDGGDASGGGD